MGNMDRAIRIFEKMQKERMQPSNRTFRPIIEGFAVAGYMKRALDTLDLMRRSGCAPTVMTYNALIHGLIRKHQVIVF
jgi:leucine-rich PPR motif-containing protein